MLQLFLAALTIPVLAADPWTPEHKLWELAYQGALLADWSQTSRFRHTWDIPCGYKGHIHEMNSILGRHPSQGEINRYFLAGSAAHFAISHALPSKWRTRWQTATFVVEALYVTHNAVAFKVKVNF